jgi:hypothetical protein
MIYQLLAQDTAIQPQFSWPSIPYPAFIATAGVALVAAILVITAKYFDVTEGLLTVSLVVIIAFVAATFASLLYSVPQTPQMELLIGGLATSLGAIIAYWLGKGRGGE